MNENYEIRYKRAKTSCDRAGYHVHTLGSSTCSICKRDIASAESIRSIRYVDLLQRLIFAEFKSRPLSHVSFADCDTGKELMAPLMSRQEWEQFAVGVLNTPGAYAEADPEIWKRPAK